MGRSGLLDWGGDSVSPAFAVFLRLNSLAVMVDGWHYDWVTALRTVVTLPQALTHIEGYELPKRDRRT